jgi:zinc protease
MDIAKQLEDLAAELSASSGLEATRVHLNCLSETLPEAIEVFSDVILHPAFQPEDLERVRGLKLTELQEKLAYPPAVASDELSRLLYGEKHPWGKPAGGTPASVKSITAKDLSALHAATFHPNNAQLTVSGDVTTDALLPLLTELFEGWEAKDVKAPRLPSFPKLKAGRRELVDRPMATQSQVWMGTRLFPAASPDAIPVMVANNALGGLFTSRLNMNLREDKNLSYGVKSQVALNSDSGALLAAGGMYADKTEEAAKEMKKELTGFDAVTDEELANGKTAIIRSLPSVLETNDAIASAFNSLTVKGLPLDYYETLSQRVSDVTKDDVGRVAQKYLAAAPWQVVVVGPAAQVKAP